MALQKEQLRHGLCAAVLWWPGPGELELVQPGLVEVIFVCIPRRDDAKVQRQEDSVSNGKSRSS